MCFDISPSRLVLYISCYCTNIVPYEFFSDSLCILTASAKNSKFGVVASTASCGGFILLSIGAFFAYRCFYVHKLKDPMFVDVAGKVLLNFPILLSVFPILLTIILEKFGQWNHTLKSIIQVIIIETPILLISAYLF